MNGDGVRGKFVFAEAFNVCKKLSLNLCEESEKRYFKIYINLSKRNPQMILA